MTTTTMRLTSVAGVQRDGGTVHRPGSEPIFTELAHQWNRAGRLVPGRRDEEWTALARPYPWPGR
ncbi:hypothetical protein ABT112_33265 [Streptomyces sp. NPDC002055]|uniref:hypothetical protein n=1 Tax=Streptomyces sp. NPDC002055 TaxID=3154534 RepID=UPI00331C3AC4